MSASSSLLAVGSVAFDSITTPFGSIQKSVGGSAVYFSLAARLFTKVSIVGVIGEDFPKKFLTRMQNADIDVSGIRRAPGKTFFWKGRYENDMNAAITEITELNVFEAFEPVLSAEHSKSRYVFLANTDPTLQLQVLKQVRNPKWVAMDTMNFWIESKREELIRLIKKVDILFLNEGEAKLISGKTRTYDAIRWIAGLGTRLLVLKRGEFGSCCLAGKDRMILLPAYLKSQVCDPTGAGDSFAGAFLGVLAKTGRLDDATIKEAAHYATIVASFNIESFGPDRLFGLKARDLKKRSGDFAKMLSV